MDEDSVLNHLVVRSGIADRVALQRALTVALRGIRDAIGHRAAIELAAHVPDSMAVVLRGPTHRAADLAQAFERVHVETGLRRDAALEATQSCLGFLGALLSDEARRELVAKLPTEWAALVDRPEPRPALAPDARAALAHRESIAASDDPHGETRLSSVSRIRGSKLAEAEPGAGARSLADARPGAGERSLAQGRPGAGERSLADLRSPLPAPGRAGTGK